MNEEIIKVEGAIVAILNRSELPIQVKRLIVHEILSTIENKCDEVTENERAKALEEERKECEEDVQ